MWAVVNNTPYGTERVWGRDKNGVHEWIVGVRATYDIQPNGELKLADEQVPPLLLPEYNGEDGASSLRYEADLVGPKPATDVILNGTAYAPKGKPAAEFLVSMTVGSVRKVIKVVGNRSWQQGTLGPKLSGLEPVTSVPIVYERAYGGFDQDNPDPSKQKIDLRNPTGCGITSKVGQSLPNFEYPSGNIRRAGPAGFGALASYWSPRSEFCGTYDEDWKKRRFPLLPEDWDSRSLLCSPADQRPNDYLRGGELIDLENLTPEGKLRFILPKVHLRFRTHIDNGIEEHRGQVATVIIEPDQQRVVMVWQSTLSVRTNGDYLDKTVVTEKVRLQ